MRDMIRNVVLCILCAGALVSCATARKSTLLLDMTYDKDYDAHVAPELVIHPEDRLAIQVLSETPQLAAPFNAGLTLADAASSAQRTVSYTVDGKGCIEFPVLGRLHVEGLTLKELRTLLGDRICEKGYIKDPVVNVNLENFTVTVIGSLGNHVIKVDAPSINLLQVLARSGAISNATRINKVSVMRTENGILKAYKVNLQSTKLFDSPVFYLQQNDIVYVMPKGNGLSTEGQTVMTFVGTGLTLASIITNVLIWSKR